MAQPTPSALLISILLCTWQRLSSRLQYFIRRNWSVLKLGDTWTSRRQRNRALFARKCTKERGKYRAVKFEEGKLRTNGNVENYRKRRDIRGLCIKIGLWPSLYFYNFNTARKNTWLTRCAYSSCHLYKKNPGTQIRGLNLYNKVAGLHKLSKIGWNYCIFWRAGIRCRYRSQLIKTWARARAYKGDVHT